VAVYICIEKGWLFENYTKCINMLSGRNKILNFKHILVAGLLARSQYPGGPANVHLDTGFSWFPCVYKRMLRWFPRLQVATVCFSCSPPDLNSFTSYLCYLYFIIMYMHNNHCHRVTAHLQSNKPGGIHHHLCLKG